MMPKFTLLLIFSFCFLGAVGQDRIFLKKDEKEIPCRIISVNDTIITYTQPAFPDSVMKARRFDVLSWFISPPPAPPAKKRLISTKEKPKPESYRYLSGEQVSGYVVNGSGDTISGIIKIKNPAFNQLYVDFTAADGKSRKYHADDNDIAAYGYEEIHYRKIDSGITDEFSNGVHSKSGMLFLQVIVDGPSKLFHYTTVFFPRNLITPGSEPPLYTAMIKQYYFMINPKGVKLLSKNRTIKGCVNRLLDDNKVLMDKIRTRGIKKHELKKTFEEYNEWYNTKSK